MIAGGIGNVRPEHVSAIPFIGATHLIVIGGPAMLIGLGGGAASSMASGQSSSDLDFASVQRDNAEMQRRCQEVIDACASLGDANPIRLIHDVGAGGLSNALPELVKDAGRGGRFEMRRVPSADPGLAPHEIWCNEAQERYVLAVAHDDLAMFERICARERCPFAVVGDATVEPRLIVGDETFHNRAGRSADGGAVRQRAETAAFVLRVARSRPPRSICRTFRSRMRSIACCVSRPWVRSSFSSRSAIAASPASSCAIRWSGPWQVPVADAAVTTLGFKTMHGEAMAMGERSPLALIDPAASARMAIGEALTNLASVAVEDLARVVLSANWMAAAGRGNEDQALFDAVTAVGMELCPALGIAIPVGKDSLSMHTQWRDARGEHAVTAPMTLIVSAFAPVPDVRNAATPVLRLDRGAHAAAAGRSRRRRESARRQCAGADASPARRSRVPTSTTRVGWRVFSVPCKALLRDGTVVAYHDRSDGGLAVCALEMAFAGRCGFDIDLAALGVGERSGCDRGAVRRGTRRGTAGRRSRRCDGASAVRRGRARRSRARSSGRRSRERRIVDPSRVDSTLLDADAAALQRRWAETSYRMQRMRDDPACADEEFERISADDPGMQRDAHVLTGRRRCRAVRQPRRATARRGVAGAGRQQSSRDGGGVRSRRFRSDRRAHVGSARGSPDA